MTNAVVQNNDNSQDVSLSILLTNNKSDNLQIKQNENFSNLLNNLSARTQKAQTDFVQKAVKSNTSSINKKAVSDNLKEVSSFSNEPKMNLKDIKDDTDYKKITIQADTDVRKSTSKKLNDVSVVSKKENEVLQSDKELVKNFQKVEDIKVIEKSESNEETESQSDINNSSLVESSPVFLPESDKKTDDSDSSADVENMLNIAPVPVVIQNQTQIQEVAKKVEDIISQIQTLEDVAYAIEDISNILDNSSLSKNEKDSIYEELNKLQTSINTVNETSDFKGLITKLQNMVIEFESLQKDSVNLSDDSFESVNTLINDEFNKLNDILADIKNILNSKDINKVDEAIKTVDKIQEVLISNVDGKSEVSDEMKVAADDLIKVFDDIKDLVKKDNSSVESIKDSLANIFSSLDMPLANSEKSIEISALKDFSQELLNYSNRLDDVDFSRLENTNQQNKDLMQEILDVFSEFQSNSSDLNLSDDLKESIKEAVDEIKAYDEVDLLSKSDVDNFNSIGEKIAQIQVKINDEINVKSFKNDIEVKDTVSTFVSPNADNSQSQANIVDAVDTFKNLSRDNGFSNSQFGEEKQSQYRNENINNDEQITANDDVVINKKVVEQKQNFINEIKEDILLDIDYGTIPEKSAALSVSDEVVKLAMDDVSVLKTDTTIKGSLLYDSASGNASIIRNVAQMIKGTQTGQNTILNQLENSDLMNQIGDKLTQLKDNSGQKLTMVLRPNDLGRLSIELTSNNLGLTTNILAQNEDVRQYIEKNIHTLRQQLTDAGISVNSIQIKTAGQEGSTNYQGNHGFEENNNSGQNNQQNSNNNSGQKEREKQETLLAMSNYDYRFAKDFSSVMNKTINYVLD